MSDREMFNKPVACITNEAGFNELSWMTRDKFPHGTKLYTHPQPIPEGMMLVPIEPTEKMLLAGSRADREWCDSDDETNGLSVVYKAMLAASKKAVI